MDPTLLSVGLAVGIGLLYKLASRITYRLALRRGDWSFTQFVLGGVAVRLFASATLVVLILAFFPVDAPVFVISLLIVFAVGLAHEVWWLHRHAGAGRRPTR